MLAGFHDGLERIGAEHGQVLPGCACVIVAINIVNPQSG